MRLVYRLAAVAAACGCGRAEQQPDGAPDQYWPMGGNMTVFGFGRQFRCLARTWMPRRRGSPSGWPFNGSFEAVRMAIQSARRELRVSR